MIYQPYLGEIEAVLNIPNVNESKDLGGLPKINGVNGVVPYEAARKRFQALQFSTSVQGIANEFGITNFKKPRLGDHPDFEYLRTNETFTEEHYIVAMFIDVKKSTNLFRKLSKEQVSLIVSIITRAATHTMALFGGHTQRIMFDGSFIYFGSKKIIEEQAVSSAINAASIFCYFMQNELPPFFEKLGLEPIFTRIGIDLCPADETLWGLNGTPECGEVSTCSLYTSLASKMQAQAKNNGIMIGEKFKGKLNHISAFSDSLRDRNGNVDESKRYIFRAPNYSQFAFNWSAYLENLGIGTKKRQSQASNLQNLMNKANTLKNGGFITQENNISATKTNISIPKNSFYNEPQKKTSIQK